MEHKYQKSLIKIAILLVPFSSPSMARCQITDSLSHYSSIVKSHIYKDYKKMYRNGGGALVYPFLTPGSNQYANVLWDWDSWLSNVALRQILSDIGTSKDKRSHPL